MWKKSLEIVENFSGFTPVFSRILAAGFLPGPQRNCRKEGIPTPRMEYLQEVGVYPESIHIFSTCGNDARQRLSRLFHIFHSSYYCYEIYIYYYIFIFCIETRLN